MIPPYYQDRMGSEPQGAAAILSWQKGRTHKFWIPPVARIEWEPPLKGRLFDKIEWEPPLKGRLFDKIEWEPPLNSGFRLAPVARIEWEPPHSILAFSVFFITHRSFLVLRGGPHSILSKRRPPENSEF